MRATFLAVLLIVAGCSSSPAVTPIIIYVTPPPTEKATATPSPAPRTIVPATATPTPTSAPAPSESPTGIPTTDGTAPEYVVGSVRVTVTSSGTDEIVGDVEQVRDQIDASVYEMNDPRVSGTGTQHVNANVYGTLASLWGTMRIENTQGVWEGSWDGTFWNEGRSINVTAWLVGSGAYEGYTYYSHSWGTTSLLDSEGVIYPGLPPAP